LHACFLSYGVLKEMLVTQDHVASPVLVLSSRLMSVVCGAVVLLCTEHRISFGAPLTAMGAFVFTNEASTMAGYEMLKYLSFPVQVMAKSCKMLPNMIMGRVVNGTRYSISEYIQAVAAVICVAVMQFCDVEPRSLHAEDESLDSSQKLCMGVALLILIFVCDSFTSKRQTALYKQHPKLTQNQMMFGGNLLGLVLTSGTLVFDWARISSSLSVAAERPAVMARIVALGVVSAMGQFCIYYAIRVLGPLSFSWIMTARQLLSVLISLVFFGHGINPVKLLCIVTVFGIMSSRQLQRAAKSVRCKGRATGAASRRRSQNATTLSPQKQVTGALPTVEVKDKSA